MHPLTPTGGTAMARMLPAGTFPAVPASTAWANTSTDVAPAGSTAASAVSNRTSPAVVHTVPAGMIRSAPAAVSTEKRIMPSAGKAPRRSSARRAAWRSSHSPWAVWGKHCRASQSVWT